MDRSIEDRVRLVRSQCRGLAEAARRLEESTDPPPQLEERLRRALTHLELAHEALDTDPQPAQTPRKRRLLGHLTDMVERLAGSVKDTGSGDSNLKLAGAIASLRSQPTGSRPGTFRGTSSSFSIADFLGFLQIQGKTGVLEVRLQDERIVLYVEGGDLIEAYSNNSPSGCRLGEIMVQTGSLEQETLDNFFVYYNPSRGRVGRALELERLVSIEQLREALTEQTFRMVQRLLSADNAPFTFTETELDDAQSDVRLSVVELLLESARQDDEALRLIEDDQAGEVVEESQPEDVTAQLDDPPAALPALDIDLDDDIDPQHLEDIREALRVRENKPSNPEVHGKN